MIPPSMLRFRCHEHEEYQPAWPKTDDPVLDPGGGEDCRGRTQIPLLLPYPKPPLPLQDHIDLVRVGMCVRFR